MIANPKGASVTESAKKISALLNPEPLQGSTGEPKEDTTSIKNEPEEVVETESEALETLDSDTEKPNRRVKTKLGDREIEFELLTEDIDPDLVSKGLMMEADYRKKTMALSDEKKAFEAKKADLDSAINEARELLMMDAEDLQTAEMLELKEVDPDAYDKKVLQLERKAKKLEARFKKRQEELAEEHRKKVLSAREKWSEAIPDWLDEAKQSSDVQKMEKYLRGNGYSDQDISAIYQPRELSLIRKAMLYDEIQSQTVEDKRVKKVLKSSKPVAATAKEQEVTPSQKAIQRLKKTGKRKDAQQAILNILGG